MADNPVPELGGLTPLQYAEKPFIDELAARGEVGSVLNVPRGLPAGSRYGHNVHFRLATAEPLLHGTRAARGSRRPA